jgi:hypothetical protein
MKPQLFALFLLFFHYAGAQQKTDTTNPYASMHADSVVIYDYNFQEEFESGWLVLNGKLSKEIKKHQKLDSASAKQFTALLGKKNSFGSTTAMCFYPHFGAIYWKNGKPAGNIQICVQCNVLRADKELKAQLQGKQGEGKNVYYTLDGMSDTFLKYLNGLIVKYHFSHPVPTGQGTHK